MSERLTAVRRCLAEAPADRVVERLAETVEAEYAITDVELFLVDYRLAALLPLAGGAPGDPARRSRHGAASTTSRRSPPGTPPICR